MNKNYEDILLSTHYSVTQQTGVDKESKRDIHNSITQLKFGGEFNQHIDVVPILAIAQLTLGYNFNRDIVGFYGEMIPSPV